MAGRIKVIALTGGIACGKSTLLNVFRELGASVIDADSIARELTSSDRRVIAAVREAFGAGIFCSNGWLNRKALAEIVFTDPAALQKLNAIVHPAVKREILARLEDLRMSGVRLVFADIPLLFEAHMESLCDEVWCAWLPGCIQLKRLMARDKLTRKQARHRIGSQMPLNKKARLSDHVICTGRSVRRTAAKAAALYERERREAYEV
jgi:dephospho-CoA kinase